MPADLHDADADHSLHFRARLGSRVEAVRWQLAIEKYIKSRGYKIGTLVAFSGEVNDSQSGPDAFTETSKALNPGLNGRDIREAFKGDEFQILLVANKFQTGLRPAAALRHVCGRRLAGIQAVQTLSRLNRAYPGKDTTYVLDFVNSSERCWPRSRPTTTRRSWKASPTQIWSTICGRSSMQPATTMSSR